jgi:hypothetical protein
MDSDRNFSVTLEGEERDVRGSQLLPLPAQQPPSLVAQSQWAEAAIEVILRDRDMTARDADLFNRMARIVVVTDGETGVDTYWKQWYAGTTSLTS